MKLLQLSVLGALLSIAASAQAAPQYSVSLLGPVNQHSETFGSSINNQAVVVGQSYTFIDPSQPFIISTATIWSKGVAATLPASGTSSNAAAINSHGQIVGSTWTTLPIDPLNPGLGSGYDGQAMLWHQGTATVLPGLYNSYGAASSINNHGQIIGWSLQGENEQVATLWNNNIPTALGTLAAYTLDANAINDQGIIVGWANGSGYSTSAVYWNSQNEAQLLNGISGQDGQAFAINESGVIAGWSRSTNNQQHATIWVDQVAVDLGTLSGWASFANDLNNQGDVVGSYIGDYNGDFGEYAVLWQNGVAINLNELVNKPDDLTLVSAEGINDAGYIVIKGYTSAGWGTYLLAPVPEPSSYALMLAGLGLISLSRRKQ